MIVIKLLIFVVFAFSALAESVAWAACQEYPADSGNWYPNTYASPTCDEDDIQDCIDAAGFDDGNTVHLPACSEEWTGDVGVSITDKYVKVQGQVVNFPTESLTTVITSSHGTAYNHGGIFIENDAGDPKDDFEISYIKFIDNTGAGSSAVIQLFVAGFDWRIHHCDLTTTQSAGDWMQLIRSQGSNGGLIDHCRFTNTQSSGTAKAIQLNGMNRGPEYPYYGSTQWAAANQSGTKYNTFIEDCWFYWTPNYPIMDADDGASVVFRYNVVSGGAFNSHGGDGGTTGTDEGYGIRWFEIYENTFDANGTCSSYAAIGIRGGTGVVYNNIGTGGYNGSDLVRMYCYCACYLESGPPYYISCNETVWSPPCTYHCDYQPGTGQNNQTDPIYIWGNSGSNSDIDIYDDGECDEGPIVIQENRDYYLATKSGYSAYTYPHPLQGESGGDLVMTLKE